MAALYSRNYCDQLGVRQRNFRNREENTSCKLYRKHDSLIFSTLQIFLGRDERTESREPHLNYKDPL